MISPASKRFSTPNVYPGEVESALSEHPEISDVAVIRVPDEDWGQRVHAVVQPRDPFLPPSVAVLDQHCREHLPAYKVLKSYEFVEQLPRSAVGKIRRSQMVEARDSGWTSEMIRVGE